MTTPALATKPDLSTVIRLHKKYHGRGYPVKIRRPKMGDRMDKAAERKFRREQNEADLELEKAQRKIEEAETRAEAHKAKMEQKYQG
jgi:hypothetical protein